MKPALEGTVALVTGASSGIGAAAAAALAPVLDGSAPVAWQNGLAQAYVLEAIARDSLGDSGAADRALERALDLAEPDGLLLPFLLHPAPGLLDRHARYPTAHPSLLAEIQDRLSGTQPSPRARPRPLLAALSALCSVCSSSRANEGMVFLLRAARTEPCR